MSWSTVRSTGLGHNISAACSPATASLSAKIRLRPSECCAPILKAADLCVIDPQGVARQLVDRGFTPRYDPAYQALSELPYDKWREYEPEDTLRFYALRLHEAGMVKSSPQKIIADGTDW